jgi:hypothetical protein
MTRLFAGAKTAFVVGPCGFVCLFVCLSISALRALVPLAVQSLSRICNIHRCNMSCTHSFTNPARPGPARPGPAQPTPAHPSPPQPTPAQPSPAVQDHPVAPSAHRRRLRASTTARPSRDSVPAITRSTTPRRRACAPAMLFRQRRQSDPFLCVHVPAHLQRWRVRLLFSAHIRSIACAHPRSRTVTSLSGERPVRPEHAELQARSGAVVRPPAVAAHTHVMQMRRMSLSAARARDMRSAPH